MATNSIHNNAAAENDASDKDGLQGGQAYSPPSQGPTTLEPTASPTRHPTINSFKNVLRGEMWYDRNANGRRDSNVAVTGLGGDVEWSHAVSGVTVQLVECDPSNGREVTDNPTYAQALTAGVDIKMNAVIARSQGNVGKYNLHVPGDRTYYYVKVTAPPGYLFTSGLCNDEEKTWECDYTTAIDASAAGEEEVDAKEGITGTGIARGITGSGANRKYRNMLRRLEEGTAQPAAASAFASGKTPFAGEGALGIKTGRSTTCVYVDSGGEVQTPLNFGVMRVGDTHEVGTNVALVLGFEGVKAGGRSLLRGLRSKEVLRRATVLDVSEDHEGKITTRYLLGDQDKEAIGTVTAEVLASTLDGRLAQNGVELDSVDPKEVILSKTSGAASDQLAVAMEIKGHYSPPPDLDFDYIVQDSINRDTAAIRRGLREYNQNCRDQTNKVNDQGLQASDFNAVVSTNGKARPGRGGGRPVAVGAATTDNTFSTACSSDILVPDYFETSLQEIEARKIEEVRRDVIPTGAVYVAEESRGIDQWALGPVAAIAGLIVLLAGAFVFRRAIGPRRVDAYSDVKTKTKDVDKSEMRRFGEAGGDMDDGSVDSAFYSEDDSDVEETEKERKMRRKRKEKEDQQGGKASSSGKSGKKKVDRAAGAKSSRQLRRKESRLAASTTGSDSTDSVGKSSSSLGEGETKGRERKRSTKERSSGDRKSSSSSSRRRESDRSSDRKSSSSSSKRGRSKRSGSDSARIV